MVQDDHVTPRQLFVSRELSAHEGPVVDDELQVERRDLPAGVARAGCRVVDVALARAEREVRVLDRVEECRRPQTPSSAYENTASPSSLQT
jgi:hypothetical protein